MSKVKVEYLDDFSGSRLVPKTVISNGKYELVKSIGEGSFGKVWLANNLKTGGQVAVKIPCNSSKEAWISFQVECLTLLGVREGNLKDDKHCLRIRDAFQIQNNRKQRYFIIVSELLGSSLRKLIDSKLMAANDGFPMQVVRSWTKQILIALQYIHDDLGVVHMDLKPDNVVLKQHNVVDEVCQSEVKVIDFSSVQKLGIIQTSFVPQTPYYRSPEALLGYPSSASMDMWSLGCMAYEFLTCETLFRFNHTRPDTLDQQLIQQMIQLIGLPPKKFALGGVYSDKYFQKNGKLCNMRRNSYTSRGCLRSLLTDCHSHLFQNCQQLDSFLDFLKQCLQWNPTDRITAQEALLHPWINNQFRNNTNKSLTSSVENPFKNLLLAIGCVKCPPRESCCSQS